MVINKTFYKCIYDNPSMCVCDILQLYFSAFLQNTPPDTVISGKIKEPIVCQLFINN